MNRPTRPDGTPVDVHPQELPASARAAALVSQPIALLLGVAALIAYRELLWYAPTKSLSEEIEQLFFLPSQGIAPLVVLLSAWLLYRRAARLRSLPPARAPRLGAALLGAAGLLHLWATLANAPDLLAPSLALAGFGVAALWKGRAAARAVLVPALFLVFALPLPAPLLNEVVFRLQLATADLTGVFLTWLGIPHHVTGDQILGTTQTFSVIESCSGLRSIETLTMVSILMADLFGRRWPHALLLVAAAPPIAFFLNGWRAIALILNPYSQLAAVHNAQGVAMLLGGLLLLFALDGLLEGVSRRLRRRRGDRGAAASARPAAGAQTDSSGTPPASLGWAAAGLAGLALASFALPRFDPAPPEALGLAAGLGNLVATPAPTDTVFLGSGGFREVATRRLERGGQRVDVFLGVGWRAGRARSALSPKTAYPGSGWSLESEQRRVLEPDGRTVRVLVFRSGSQTVLAYHWYEGASGLVIETLRSLLALDSGPLRHPEDILAMRMTTRIEGPIASGLEPALERLDALYVPLRKALDGLPGRGAPVVGKAFPDFPAWVKIFRRVEAAPEKKPHEIRGLERETELGMPLAS